MSKFKFSDIPAYLVAILIAAVVFVPVMVLTSAYIGFCLHLLWGWYVAPLVHFNLSWVQFTGFLFILIITFQRYVPKRERDRSENIAEALLPASFTLVGWLIHHFWG